MPIVPYLKGQVFDPKHIRSMSWALEEICNSLGVCDDQSREIIATRVIELARRGERDGLNLRDRVLQEANGTPVEPPAASPWHHQART
jgi:hypothetical protein